MWPASISAISALNFSVLGNAMSFVRMVARFKAAAGFAVNHTGFNCDVQNVSKERDGVVVVCR